MYFVLGQPAVMYGQADKDDDGEGWNDMDGDDYAVGYLLT
jgi:hypothetical protein